MLAGLSTNQRTDLPPVVRGGKRRGTLADPAVLLTRRWDDGEALLYAAGRLLAHDQDTKIRVSGRLAVGRRGGCLAGVA